MAIPTTKSELLQAIPDRFAKLEAALDAASPELADEKSLEGHAKGTVMSAKDLVSYLIGWNALVSKWLNQEVKGQTVEFPEVDYKWIEFGALVQKFYADYPDHSFGENWRLLAATKEALVAEILTLTDEELYGTLWQEK